MERQNQAATLGMWVFLASEILFFGALFTLYSSYRARSPTAFASSVAENTIWWGSLNTAVLLTSSFLVALAVHSLRHHRRMASARLTWATALLGVVFLLIKGYEYYLHFQRGIFPGAHGPWFNERARQTGTAAFWTLYYLMTGLHAVHVIVGIAVLTALGWLVHRRRISTLAPQALENGALYWHLVDIIWLFLWPLFYLTKGAGT
jgi:cytochrome c oxidase subunit 3